MLQFPYTTNEGSIRGHDVDRVRDELQLFQAHLSDGGEMNEAKKLTFPNYIYIIHGHEFIFAWHFTH